MSDFLLSYGVASYVTQNILIIPFQADFYTEVILAFRQDILRQIYTHTNIKGLIIDLSTVNLIDMQNMRVIEELVSMVNMLGVISYLVGIKPAVTMALVELEYASERLNTALTIEQASRAIQAEIKIRMSHAERAHII